MRKLRVIKAIEFTWKPIFKQRSLSQNALMHVWFDAISKYLLLKGRKEWTPEFTKRAMKHSYLGYETIETFDVETGEIITREELRSTRSLTQGEAYHFLTCIDHWALGTLSLSLRRPDDCE